MWSLGRFSSPEYYWNKPKIVKNKDKINRVIMDIIDTPTHINIKRQITFSPPSLSLSLPTLTYVTGRRHEEILQKNLPTNFGNKRFFFLNLPKWMFIYIHYDTTNIILNTFPPLDYCNFKIHLNFDKNIYKRKVVFF